MPQPLGRQAPPVQVTTSGGRLWRALQVVLAALATAVGAWWCTRWLALGFGADLPAWFTWAQPWLVFTVVTMAALAAAGCMARHTRPQPHHLVWNGQVWRMNDQAGQVQVMLDLGRWVLLRFAPDSAPELASAPRLTGRRGHWLDVPAADAGEAWHGLRAALYSRAALNPPPETGWPPA